MKKVLKVDNSNMKKCSKCKKLKPFAKFYTYKLASGEIRPISHCSSCSVKVVEASKAKKREMYNAKAYQKFLKFPKKNHARATVRYALLSGKLKKLPCQVWQCNKKKVHAHHIDYNFELEIIWLCPSHHLALHKNLKNDNA